MASPQRSSAAESATSPAYSVATYSAATGLDTAGPDTPAPDATAQGSAGLGGDSLPPGWSASAEPGGIRLSYRASAPIPLTDAGARVTAAGRDLGTARVDGSTASIILPRLPRDVAALELRVGQRPVEALLDDLRTAAADQPSGAGSRRVPAPDTATVPASLTPRAAEPITSVDYLLSPLKDPEVAAPMQVLARITAPRTPRADRPLVVFAHGRHGTCYRRDEVSGEYPCPAGWRSLPSLLGYQYAQRLLAGQGFVTVSIDLNGVNGQDDLLDDGGAGARARLIRHHLATLAAWNDNPGSAPFAKKLSLRFDTRRILLVGHSRGGEGVQRAVAESEAADSFSVTGLLLIAPTNFARQTVPTIPTTVLLPSCDGDVSDLQGQIAVDRALDAGIPTALHTAVYVPGSNHNFFNSEWTPATSRAASFDDGEGSGCTARTRLTDTAVRSVGATYALGAAFGYLTGDDRGVRLLDGSVGTPAGLAVRGILASPVGGPRQLLWRGNLPGTPNAVVVGGRICHGISDQRSACTTGEEIASPHWLTLDDRTPPAARLTLARAKAAAGLRFTQPADLGRADHLDLRVIIPPRTVGRLAVRVEDSAGRVATVTPTVGASVRGLPAVVPPRDQPGGSGRWWGQLVRAPLTPARQAGVDLSAVRAISLVTPGGGLDGAVLLDVSAAALGLGATTDPVPLPRLAALATTRSIPEGSTTRTESLSFQLSRPASADLEVIATVVGPGDGPPVLKRLPLAAGLTRLDVPVTVVGDRVYGPDRIAAVMVEVRGPAVTGAWISRLNIVEDDPAPRLTMTPTAAAKEGRALVWTATLDRVSGQDVLLEVSAVATRRELSVGDLSPAARRTWYVEGPLSRPLSQARLTTTLAIPAGTRTLQIVMGTAKDRLPEGTERVVLQVIPTYTANTRPLVLTGTVTD